LLRIPFSGAAYARTGPEGCRMPKIFSKNVRLSGGVAGRTAFLFCCTKRRLEVGDGLWLSNIPNSVGRGGGKGMFSASLGTAGLGIGRKFSGSAIAAEGAGGIDSKFDLTGELCASETGVEPEKKPGSNSAL